ncbi:MAG: DedA family protein [Methylotetracoccus sp.]|nr:DedA family protein [Methylotetracoccus sp.]
MTEWTEHYGLWGLFASAFVSSTLAPGGSEAVLAYLVTRGHFSGASLLGVATLGNTLGAITTWALGSLLASRFPVENALTSGRQRAVARVRRWGVPLLLFSWLPLVGDGFCFAAGWLRLPFSSSLIAIALGKALRYGAILLAFH